MVEGDTREALAYTAAEIALVNNLVLASRNVDDVAGLDVDTFDFRQKVHLVAKVAGDR